MPHVSIFFFVFKVANFKNCSIRREGTITVLKEELPKREFDETKDCDESDNESLMIFHL